MNQGAKYTLVIAAVLFGAAVFPLLAVAASLVLVGMALHSILGTQTTIPTVYAQPNKQLNHEADQIIKQARKELDHDHR